MLFIKLPSYVEFFALAMTSFFPCNLKSLAWQNRQYSTYLEGIKQKYLPVGVFY